MENLVRLGCYCPDCWLSLGKRDFCVSPVEILMDHLVVILDSSEVDTTREGGSGEAYQL